MKAGNPPPDLEERFKEPEGMRWHAFNRNGRKIRFGSVFPKDSIPDAVIVCLPGLSEFSEKYFETARDLTSKNLAFWIIDWMGQGGSGRYLANPHMRHADKFDEDVEDLHYLVLEYIKHSSVHPDVGRIPMAMLGHSMGGNLGLKYLAKHPGTFECAAFTAPFLGVYGLSKLPYPIMRLLTFAFNEIGPLKYAKGQKDWFAGQRPNPGHDEFSSDFARGSLHEKWMAHNPELRLGGVTSRWVYEAVRSCHDVMDMAHKIEIPCLIALAEHEKIVDNGKIIKLSQKLKQASLLPCEGAQHEILMERDEIRAPFLGSFYDLIKTSIIDRPETLKPF